MTTAPARILFVQHAGSLGGSAMSLLYTLQSLPFEEFRPLVALARPSPELHALYADAGFETEAAPGIGTFEHTTARHLRPWSPRDVWAGGRLALGWKGIAAATCRLVERVAPALVHLNSVVLAPSAWALRALPTPVVWHVREHPARGAMGLRTRFLRRGLRRWPDAALFISEADRRAWLGSDTGGLVLPNFVPLERFDPGIDRGAARRALDLPQDAPVVLFMGGLSRLKGVMPLLAALRGLRDDGVPAVCLMPGAVYEPSRSLGARAARRILPLVGSATPSQAVRSEIDRLGLAEACLQLPFRTDVPELIAASDVVVFPALEPHFARPAIEASAMGRPVVASDLAGIRELVRDGDTGLLVPAGDAARLGEALRRVLEDPSLASRLGAAGRARAEALYSAKVQGEVLAGLYRRLLRP